MYKADDGNEMVDGSSNSEPIPLLKRHKVHRLQG